MKVPVSWLQEYLPCEVTPSEIAERLTFSGTEVVAMETSGGECPGVKVGEITAIERHPGADSLRVCDVSDGGQSFRVVCGASNFTVGDRAAFAPPGTTLCGGRVIGETVIRGEASSGMLCAEDELGLSDDHDGILVLDAGVAPGTPLSDVTGPADTVFELEITWNRPDCLSVIGLAREVAAILRVPLQVPDVAYPESDEKVESWAAVSVEDPLGCPRYTARILRNVQDGRAPFWMRRRLRLCGVRPLGTVVDITNYVMLECGHPLHAFDRERLAEGRIVVRRAKQGERIVTLDGVERELDAMTLVIADAASPVAVAGVMGGEGSEIRERTETVLLESASFDPAAIRSCSSRLSLSTESSHRFERGVDMMGVDWASRRAAQLMVAHAGAAAARGVVDVFPRQPEDRVVRCRFTRTRSLLGVDVAGDEVCSIFQALGMTVADRDNDGCTVRVPSYRPDIRMEADLVEEVARIHGLDGVPEAPPASRVAGEADHEASRAAAECRGALIALGLAEVVNYTFTSPALLDEFGGGSPASRASLPNPVSREQSILRPSLLPLVASVLAGNAARRTVDLAVFEMGVVFARAADGSVSEKEQVAVGLMGEAGRTEPGRRKPVENEEMMLWVKGIVEALCRAMRARDVSFEASSYPAFEEGWCADLSIEGETCGRVGLLCAAFRDSRRIRGPLGMAEIDYAAMARRVFETPRVVPVPTFPSIGRDVAMIVDEGVTHGEIVAAMERAAPDELTAIRLFDIFRDEGLGKGKKSLAYSLDYRSAERTLTDEEANGFHDRIKQALRSELNAEIREGELSPETRT